MDDLIKCNFFVKIRSDFSSDEILRIRHLISSRSFGRWYKVIGFDKYDMALPFKILIGMPPLATWWIGQSTAEVFVEHEYDQLLYDVGITEVAIEPFQHMRKEKKDAI